MITQESVNLPLVSHHAVLDMRERHMLMSERVSTGLRRIADASTFELLRVFIHSSPTDSGADRTGIRTVSRFASRSNTVRGCAIHLISYQRSRLVDAEERLSSIASEAFPIPSPDDGVGRLSFNGIPGLSLGRQLCGGVVMSTSLTRRRLSSSSVRTD